MKEIRLYLDGLDCAGCAGKIEDRVNKLSEVKEATLNFTTQTLIINPQEDTSKDELFIKAKEIINKLEPHVKVTEVTDRDIHKYNLDKGSYKKVKLKCNEERCNVKEEHNHSDREHHTEASEKYHDKHDHSKDYTGDHDHSHDHVHAHDHGELTKVRIARFLIAALLYAIAIAGEFNFYLELGLFLISYILVGGDILLTAAKNIARGEIFDENFLMSLATLGAFSIKQFPEAVAVMLFYQIGEMFQDMAVGKSRKSITALMNIRPDFATLIKGDKEVVLSPEEVKLGEVIIVKPGEKVPLDGIVIDGNAALDTSALTGESLPRDVKKGDEVLSGTINKNGLLKIQVTKEFGESTVAKILHLVENAGNKKAPTEKFISKFARYYTPAVVFLAVLLAILPPLLIAEASFSQWFYRALAFLVVSCPCALVISIPLSFFGGIGAASKQGILVKGGNYLEALNKVEAVVFDKTGTLTKGNFKVSKINSVGSLSDEELIEAAAYGEYYSKHPIALSILEAYKKKINKGLISDFEEISGKGIRVKVNGVEVLLGNKKLMSEIDMKVDDEIGHGTIVYVVINNKYEGNIVIEDEIKIDSYKAISELNELGIYNTVMLTGDNSKAAMSVGAKLKIKNIYSELLPGDKVERFEEIIKAKASKGNVIFVGDGINDAPVLARADIGIAMGGVGSDAAIEAADIVIMTDEPSKIAKAIRIARSTNVIVWQNIIFALAVKVLILILVAFGMSNMWEAVFGDVGVALIAVLNSMRILKLK